MAEEEEEKGRLKGRSVVGGGERTSPGMKNAHNDRQRIRLVL